MNNSILICASLVVVCAVTTGCVFRREGMPGERPTAVPSAAAPAGTPAPRAVATGVSARGIVPGRTHVGPPREVLTLDKFVDRAPIVVVGRVESTDLAPSREVVVTGLKIPVLRGMAAMRILRIYKGMLPGSVTVPVYYPATERGYDLGYGEIDPGQTELFFLKKDVSGQLGFYSHYNFGFPLSDTRPEVPAGSPPQSALEAELMCTATTGPDQIAQNAMRALWTNPDGTRLAKTIAQNPRYSQGLQAIAVGYLVKAHVPGAVDTDIRFLKSVRQKKTDPNAIVLAAGPIEARGDLPLRQAWELVGLRMVEVDRFLAIMIRASGRRDFAPVAMEILQHSRDQRAPDDAAIYLARLRHDPKMYSGRVTPARVQEYLKWWNTEGRAKYGAAG